MRHNARSIAIRGLITILILGIFGYGIFASRDLIRGPYLEVTAPADGLSTASSTILVTGLVKRVQELTINDSPVPISTEGNFEEAVYLHPGNNTVSVKVHDKFGKKVSLNLNLVRIRD